MQTDNKNIVSFGLSAKPCTGGNESLLRKIFAKKIYRFYIL